MDDGKRSSYDRRNPRGAVPDTDDESDNNTSEIDVTDDTEYLNADVQFEEELGYGLIVMFRGRTTGRRVKRELCCLTAYQLIVAISMSLLSYNVARVSYIVKFLDEQSSGILGWMDFTSTICFIWSGVTIVILRFWSSLVTNRMLLSTILKIYVLALFVKFILVSSAVASVFNTFGSGPRYGAGASADANNMLKYYILIALFLVPYLVVVILYGLNISYLNEEVEMGGNIREPNPVGAIDLRGVTLTECCTVVLAYPLAIIYQCMELIYAVYLMGNRGWYFFWRRYEEHRQASALAKAAAAAERAKKGRSFFRRLTKTLNRYLRMVPGFRPKLEPLVPAVPSDQRIPSAGDKELAERLEQERVAEEANRRAQFEKQRREKEAILEEERKKIEGEAAAAARKLAELQEEEERINSNMFKPTLNADKFKELWGSLSQSGSFQCKLKSMPDIQGFTSHLNKQGFCVVFAAGPGTSGDIEVGLCNVRTSPDEKWFLSRLVAKSNSFSAIMKAEAPELVPTFVKKFALAKILKIDTTKK